MIEYTPTTDEMRNVYASVWALGIRSGPPGAIEYNHGKAKFDRWLNEIRAEAWDEGFAEGVNDVYLHEDTSWDEPCIPNPYRTSEK